MAYNPPNPNGQATMANSQPVVIASDQASFPVNITAIVPGTGATNLGKAEDSVHTSADVGVFSLSVANVAQATFAADGDYIPRSADLAGNSMMVGNIAALGTDAGNPIKIGGVNRTTKPTVADGQRSDLQVDTRGNLQVALVSGNTSTFMTVRADNADGVASSGTAGSLQVIARNTLANGSNWDRQNVVVNATNSVGTGIAAAGILAQFDDVSPTAITENQFGNLRMSSDRQLYTEHHYTAGRVTADGQIKGSAGFVHTISIAPMTATPTAGLITIYDSLTETGTILYSEWIFATTPGHTITLDVAAATGIYVGYDGTVTNVSVTVSYR